MVDINRCNACLVIKSNKKNRNKEEMKRTKNYSKGRRFFIR